jgi:hypothetical protein
MIACQLLIEITAFLRESHGIYQIRRDSKGMQGRGRGRKSFGGGAMEKRRLVKSYCVAAILKSNQASALNRGYGLP